MALTFVVRCSGSDMHLTIHGWGAVTAVGLTASETCAAIRAAISGFREVSAGLLAPEPQIAAPVPAKWRLRRSPTGWLVNLASRAIDECLRDEQPDPRETVLALAAPEAFREHPAMADLATPVLIRSIESRLGLHFHPRSCVLSDGPAAVFRALHSAPSLFGDATVRHCIVGGVDSLVNEIDMSRLRAAGRLRDGQNPQGLVPGEGAAFVLVSPTSHWRRVRPLGQVLSTGVGMEPDNVLGPKYSLGDGMRAALSTAAAGIEGGEASVGFATSTFNGERYGAWEAMITHPRFYRKRREHIDVIYPAMSVGDVGTAASALAVIVAGMAIARGYAPGDLAMCEAYSDEGLRGACVIGPPLEPPAFSAPGCRAS
jgi:3-oxoacyl-[acyl-carrier-protein] synthase-1